MKGEYTANCAVCGGPGEPECPCEGERLQKCIDQAEKAWIESWIKKTREWATNNAINNVTTLFNKKKEQRKNMYREQVMNIPYWPQYQEFRGRPPLHPNIIANIRAQLAEAELQMKRGIDYDWRMCVVKYPEVLAYYYNQIKVPLPAVAEPPTFPTALSGGGVPRPPSVINPGPPMSTIGANINRSATAPPKKTRRSSKVNGGLDDDTMAQLMGNLESLTTQSRGRPKASTPAPSMTPGPGSARPKGKRRESKDMSGMGGMGGMGMGMGGMGMGMGPPRGGYGGFAPPPQAPPPPGGDLNNLRASLVNAFSGQY